MTSEESEFKSLEYKHVTFHKNKGNNILKFFKTDYSMNK